MYIGDTNDDLPNLTMLIFHLRSDPTRGSYIYIYIYILRTEI